MGSVDLIAKVTSEGYERSELWLRAKRVMVVFNNTPMEEVSGVFFLTAHFVIPVSSLTLMEEGSGVFFLTLLTSSSLCSHTHDLSSHPSHRYP